MSTGLSQDLCELGCNSQTDSQDQYEEIEGIEEQELIGQDEEDRLPQMGICEQSNVAERCTECSKVKKNYRSFISLLIRQLPATKRKLAEQEYEQLENDGGKCIL
jgi:hypothetical protein